MNLILDLYSRFRHLVHEVAKFGIVGGLGALLQFLVQDTLHFKLGVGALSSEFVGIVGGIIVTFIGNRYWTYRDRRSHGRDSIRESALFVVMCLIGLGIQLGLQAIVTYGLGYKDGLSYNLATAFGIGIATLFRLFAYRTFVFRVPTPASGAVEQLEPETTTRYR
ncbi:MAG TPA: GtrA family protein [Trebonia sp.]|nr:GtrA family protein [Trebonia sp.]